MTNKLLLGMCAVTMVLAFGCNKGEGEGTTAAEVAASYEGPIASSDVTKGVDVYATFCEGCHPGGAKGDGPAITGIAWPAPQMRKQIREGEDEMPGFGPSKISNDDLEALLAYMVTLGSVAQ